MAQFILAYHGGNTDLTPEDIKKGMAAWGAWFGQLGDAIVQPGAPASVAKTVSASSVTDGGGSNPITGYSVINAPDMDAAVEMAKGCPVLANGTGTVEVAELVEM